MEYTLYQIFKGRGKTATTGCVGNIGKDVDFLVTAKTQ